AWGSGFLYLCPLIIVAVMRGQTPWEAPGLHVGIPIGFICLLPAAYLLMPLCDGVLLLGSPRPTTPRAAMLVRCIIADTIALVSLVLFFLTGEIRWWPLVYWLLGLPAVVGIFRRVGAYQAAMKRIATGQTLKQ
ncbi:MAG: hypothetical protein ACUVX8_02155, partial [Candidatus Zipacnadales bacterium]